VLIVPPGSFCTRASSQESIDEIEEEGQDSDYSLEFDDDNETLPFGQREDIKQQGIHATNSAAFGDGSATHQQRHARGLGYNGALLSPHRTRSPR